MKTVEEIEKEYENYEQKSTFVTSLAEFLSFIENGIYDTEQEISVIQKEMKINNRSEKITKLKNHFPFLFETTIGNVYNEDNQLLVKELELVMGYKEKFERISSMATNENFQELTRLVDFSCEYYNQHIDFFESQRDTLEYSCQGFTYCNNKYQNNTVPFDEFFDKKVSRYISEKPKEKIKGKR